MTLSSEIGKSSIEADELISAITFCPFEAASNLIAYTTTTSLYICSVSLNSLIRGGYTTSESHEILSTYNYTGVSCISWSSLTTVLSRPRCVKLAVGTDDAKVCIIITDLKEDSSTLTLEGHTKRVNAVAFGSCSNTERLASASDDHTCKIWDGESGIILTSISLSYAAVDLSWNIKSAGTLMVAQLPGVIRFYSVKDYDDHTEVQATAVLECDRGTLVSAHWCQVNAEKVGAVVGNEWVLWNLSKCGLPEDKKQSHSGGATSFRWANHHEDVFLTQGRPKHTLKVHHLGQRELVLHEVYNVGTGASWHAKLPICAVAASKRVDLYDLSAVTGT